MAHTLTKEFFGIFDQLFRTLLTSFAVMALGFRPLNNRAAALTEFGYAF
jgi:hypothetical protein